MFSGHHHPIWEMEISQTIWETLIVSQKDQEKEAVLYPKIETINVEWDVSTNLTNNLIRDVVTYSRIHI